MDRTKFSADIKAIIDELNKVMKSNSDKNTKVGYLMVAYNIERKGSAQIVVGGSGDTEVTAAALASSAKDDKDINEILSNVGIMIELDNMFDSLGSALKNRESTHSMEDLLNELKSRRS